MHLISQYKNRSSQNIKRQSRSPQGKTAWEGIGTITYYNYYNGFPDNYFDFGMAANSKDMDHFFGLGRVIRRQGQAKIVSAAHIIVL